MHPQSCCFNMPAGMLAAVFLLAHAAPTEADSMRAQCGFSGSPQTRPAATSPCVFSQRQGYASVRIEGGESFEFSPVGDTPGNFTNAQSTPVYRLSGLGDEGQLFKLPSNYLYVFWQRDRWSCPREQLRSTGTCYLSYGALGFALQATTEGSINRLQITPSGLSIVNDSEQVEVDGSVYGAELADLDANGFPELYVYASSAGSGSYGSLIAYAVNNGKSMTPIYLPPMSSVPGAADGYMGHDEFAVVENRLVRRFPVYLKGDTNTAPSGGTRQLQYRLEAGEAGWLLVADKVVDY
jgi:hypothetical protein